MALLSTQNRLKEIKAHGTSRARQRISKSFTSVRGRGCCVGHRQCHEDSQALRWLLLIMAHPHGPRKRPAPDAEHSPTSLRFLAAVLLALGSSTCILAWQSIYFKTVLGEWHSHFASRIGPVLFAIVAGAFLPDGCSGWNPTALACSLFATLPSLKMWHSLILSPGLNAQPDAVVTMTHWGLAGRGVLLAALLGTPSLALLSARLLSVVRLKLSNVVVSKTLTLVITAALPAQLQRFVSFPRPVQTLPAIISILIAINIWTLHRPRSTRRTLVWAVPITILAVWVASSVSVPQRSVPGQPFKVLSQTRLQLDGSLLAIMEGALEDHPGVRLIWGSIVDECLAFNLEQLKQPQPVPG